MSNVYLHIGLHKTGSTYFQRVVWPNWKGVYYTGRKSQNGKNLLQALARAKDQALIHSSESMSGSLKGSYLVEKQWLEESLLKLERVASSVPSEYSVKIIVSLRRHDSWALSIYKHYLKYGGVEDLESFFGLKDGCPATMQLDDLRVMPRLRKIEEVFGVKPFCFFLEEVVGRPRELAEELATFVDKSNPPHFQNVKFNQGMNFSQARVCQLFNRLVFNRGCYGKGFLFRNHYGGYLVARNLARFGLLPRSREIQLSTQLLHAICNELNEDLSECLKYVSAFRSAEFSLSKFIGKIG